MGVQVVTWQPAAVAKFYGKVNGAAQYYVKNLEGMTPEMYEEWVKLFTKPS